MTSPQFTSRHLEQIHIQCIFGDEDIRHIQEVLIPSLVLASSSKLVLHYLNFESNRGLDAASVPASIELRQVDKFEGQAGFGANHNKIFASYQGQQFFLLINPDCVVEPNSIDVLVETYFENDGVGIVEGRQWPFELTKGYNPETLETSWAAGAFTLIDTAAYSQLDGMDENYFLYAEDVDLSWRMWLLGKRVLYQPKATVVHYTGSRHYQQNFTSLEWFYGVRNFLYISAKFFGKQGLARARNEILNRVEPSLANWATTSFDQELLPHLMDSLNSATPPAHPMVRLSGLGGYGA